jgi:protein TonB
LIQEADGKAAPGETFMVPMSMGKQRLRAAAAAALVELALAYALFAGLAVQVPRAVVEPLKNFGLLPEPPPPPPRAPPAPRFATPEREGAASPPNIRSTATEIVAPPPRIALPALSPIVAAPLPGLGADPTAGAAPIRGPGTGSGGEGDGSGSGSGGDGPGGGGGSPPVIKSGRLRDSDYPRAAAEAGIGGTVEVQYTVGTDGRPRNCRIMKSSGNGDLDATTCRMILLRYRYRPARDRQGRPIDSEVADTHEWINAWDHRSRDDAPR